MVDVNIPAVATGAFFGLLAVVVLVSCVPPVTRFLGDLCCCPWHIPFTKRRRRNADEELDKDDLPYVAGPRTPLAGSPADDVGYQRVSAAYMSAVNVVDPELAKEDMRRSRESRREGSPYRHHHHHQHGPDHYQHPYGGGPSGTAHLQVPGPDAPPRGWRGGSPPQHSRSPDRRARRGREDSAYYDGGGGDGGYGGPHHLQWAGEEDGYHDPYAYVDGGPQRPRHAYSPPEAGAHHGHGHHDGSTYFHPQRPGGYDEGYHGGGGGGGGGAWDYEHSSEYLAGPRQHPHAQV